MDLKHGRSKKGFLILPHPLTNFRIQTYYQHEPRFSGIYFRDNLPFVPGILCPLYCYYK